jgi:mannose-6-phosphate isomerase
MANSDNVLRGGLTGKHIDVPELMKILAFKPYKPGIITPDASCFSYPALCEEFRLARICGCGPAEPWPPVAGSLAAQGPLICIVTEGELIIADGDSETVVKRGESLFIPPVKSGDVLSLKGNFTLFAASCGCAASIRTRA